MDAHPIQWVAPSPLWPELAKPGNGSAPSAFGAPTILRFATDDFMQDFFNLLATDPRQLGGFRAVRETWRGKSAAKTIPTPKKIFALQLQRLGNTLRRASDTGVKPPELSDATALENLKLYQPAHLRYYLVTACLTCQIAGLPDRKVDAGKQQRVGFVVRRLIPPTPDGDEYAWVKTPAGSGWKKVRTQSQDPEDVVLDLEERLPLFPATYQDDDQRSRRLFAGLVPVGRREAYLGSPQISDTSTSQPPGTSSITAVKILLREQVIEPWKALLHQMAAAGGANPSQSPPPANPPPPDGLHASTRSARERAQTISWLILLDFAKWLETYVPELWQSVVSGTRPPPNLKQMGLVFDALQQANLPASLAQAVQWEYDNPTPTVAATLQQIYPLSPPANLLAALAKFGDSSTGLVNTVLEQKLESAEQPYSRNPSDSSSRDAWPDFPFPLADPDSSLSPPLPVVPDLGTLQSDEAQDLSLDDNPSTNATDNSLDQFAVLLVRALAESNATPPAPEIPAAAIPPADQQLGNPFLANLFCLRCVYERPTCGPLHEDVVSDPTEPFELAGFFDPDAPARPIRIGLPIDTTPAGLRKFNKNTAFIMSDVLCGQVKRVKGMTFGDLVLSVLPWPFHQDLPGGDMSPCSSGSPAAPLGTICSLSIPIITLCALFLLIIMVTLLDIIFCWLPFLMICFPLPGFKAKKT